ncbi:hypothetical protein B4Q04_03405 [Zobellia sp. OII3]|uniref:restriction endonuclease subunit S n=1 Tax=Zobellia sp. OII3 TaxID=2034520 RepID=UPI000B536095|nr:restriction endonuclease subunit S [Zobellia sp. OII3]OWW26743.1 hypothetical protein B4Q04_03405 [Zobellia sp. OII3]
MPENWKTYKLGDLIEVNSNSIRKGELEWLHYIDIKSVGSGFYESPTKLDFKDAPSRARRLLLEGDTVISSVRPNLKSFFYANNLKENTIASTGFAVLTPKKIDPRFLYYLTTNDNYIDFLVQSCTGSAYPAFGPKVVTDSTVTIPEIKEQRAIASILSAIDDKIENNLAMNKTLEDMAMALYKHWFVDFGPFKDGKFIDSELGKIPEGWEVKTYSDITTKITDGAHYSPKTYDKGFPMASVKDMNAWGFNLNTCRIIGEDDYNKLVSQGCQPLKNDIVIAKDGSWLKHAFVVEHDLPLVLLSSIAILRPNGTLNPHLINLNLKLEETKGRMASIVTGAVIQRIVLKDFRKFEVVVPDIKSQENACKDIVPLIEKCWANNNENQTLTQLRDTLLPKLISGEVRLKEFKEKITAAL